MVARTLREEALTTSTTSRMEMISVISISCSDERDRIGAVAGDVDLHVRRQLRLQLRQLRAHAVDGFDDVGAGLRAQDDDDRRLSVEQAEVVVVLHAVDHLRHVLQADRRCRCASRPPVGGSLRRSVRRWALAETE